MVCEVRARIPRQQELDLDSIWVPVIESSKAHQEIYSAWNQKIKKCRVSLVFATH